MNIHMLIKALFTRMHADWFVSANIFVVTKLYASTRIWVFAFSTVHTYPKFDTKTLESIIETANIAMDSFKVQISSNTPQISLNGLSAN